MDAESNKAFLLELSKAKMPFGKYKGRYLVNIPEAYYTWYSQKGFPAGKLGRQLQAMHEIKINGLEGIIHKIKNNF